MERGTFKDPAFVRQINDVCVPLVMPTSWKEWPGIDVKVGDKIEKRYKDYPRLTTEEAKGLMNSAESTVPYGKEFESWVTPVYVIGNDKKEMMIKTLDRKVINTNRIFADIQAGQAKLGGGKGANQALYRQFRKSYDAAVKALADEKFGDALKLLAEQEKVKGLVDSMKTEIEALRKQIGEKGEEKLGTLESKEDLQKLADQFKGHALESKILDKLK